MYQLKSWLNYIKLVQVSLWGIFLVFHSRLLIFLILVYDTLVSAAGMEG